MLLGNVKVKIGRVERTKARGISPFHGVLQPPLIAGSDRPMWKSRGFPIAVLLRHNRTDI